MTNISGVSIVIIIATGITAALAADARHRDMAYLVVVIGILAFALETSIRYAADRISEAIEQNNRG